jgi:uncharacterized protein YjbI with pentapeptide repeats
VKVNGYKIKPKADLSWADLSGTDLAGAKLGRANLKGANLEGANLSSAKLKRANLEGANLASANLRFADLEEADLTGADLTDAALCGANLSFAWLHRANLTRADLEEALLLTTRLTEANLTGAVLTGAVFQPTFDNFIVADETTVWPAGFDPEVAWASGAVIQTTEELAPHENAGISKEGLAMMRDYIRDRNPPERLRRVELVAQYLMEDTEVDQGEDELTAIKYHLSTEEGVEDLKMHYAPALIWAFSELEEGRYEFARFFPDRSINLQEPELADYFRRVREELQKGDVGGEAEEVRVELGDAGERVIAEVDGHEVGPGVDLSGADLAGADLAGADLRASNLYKTNLAEANLSHANLSDAQIQETNLVGANLTDASLTNVRPLPENDSDWRSGRDTPAAAASIGANLAGANLAGANLAGANLAGANLAGANLAGANLAGANLYGANLDRADLTGATLTETHLNRTEVHGTNFTDTNLADADFMFLAFDGETVWPEGCPFGIPE